MRRRTAWKLLGSLPGLFDHYPNGFTASFEGEATSVRLVREGKAFLAFKSIAIDGRKPNEFAGASFSAGPRLREVKPADAHLGFWTGRGLDSYWRMDLPAPSPVKEITVTLQRGPKGSSPRLMTIEVDGPSGLRTASPGDDQAVVAQLARFRAEWAAFAGEDAALAQSGAALADAADAILDKAAGAESGATRAGVIADVAERAERLEGPELRAFLSRAASVLPWLIDYRKPRTSGEVEPHDLKATAMVFCARILAKGKVGRRRTLNNYLAILAGPKEYVEVEAEVARLYRRCGGDPAFEPIMFRKHGLTGAGLVSNREAYLTAMQSIEAALAPLGYEALLHYGTLLGAVRDGGFIPHDDDVDMAITLEGRDQAEIAEEVASLTGALAAQKFAIRESWPGGLPLLQLRPPGRLPRIDVFCMARGADDSLIMHMEKLRPRALPADVVLPLRPIELYGRVFRAPADAAFVLAERYGADWRTPRRWVSRSKSIA